MKHLLLVFLFILLSSACCLLIAETSAQGDSGASPVALQELLQRMYDRDMAIGNAGRQRWHGRRTKQIIDNGQDGELIRIDVYEDGFVYTNSPAARHTVIKQKIEIIDKRLPSKVQNIVSNRIENAMQK